MQRELGALIRRGHLFKVQEELARLRVDAETQVDWSEILRTSVDTGFHDMVQVLLESRFWSPDELQRALDHSLWNHRLDIAELLIAKGAPLSRVDVHDILHTMDVELIRDYFRRGVDPAWQNGFAQALNSTKAKPLLRIYRSLREEFPVLDAQAALALSEAVNEKNARWVSLLRWAGADPFRPVPWGFEGGWDDEESLTTAASRACWGDRDEIFRILKLRPTPDQAVELLYDAVHQPQMGIAKQLLECIPRDRINDTERGSSKALETLVREEHREYGYERTTRPQREAHTLEFVELLLDRGARWNPDDDHLRWTRRGLASHDGKYVVRMLRLLLYTDGACEPARIWELCRTDTIKSRIRLADAPLWQELLALRP